MKTIKSSFSLLLCVSVLTLAACSDDAATAADARPDSPMVDAAVPKVFKQVEHLARPGINEVLLFTNAFSAGFNATAPSFTGVPPDTLTMVVTEAKTVLKALYLGTCLLNGVAGVVDPAQGLHPAGITCHALGGAIFTSGTADGTTLTALSMSSAQAYADKVFDQFVPDVMRVDMSVAVSSYETPCAALDSKPVLCGGRFVDDDVIDTTYDYFLNGASLLPPPAPVNLQGGLAVYTQFSALVSDGVNFASTTANKNNRTPSCGIPTGCATPNGNPAQFHPPVTGTFPYSATAL